MLLIRLWRPLSIAYKQKYILSILKSLVSSISEIFNVFLVVFLVGLLLNVKIILIYLKIHVFFSWNSTI